jgi:hypothetical protein
VKTKPVLEQRMIHLFENLRIILDIIRTQGKTEGNNKQQIEGYLDTAKEMPDSF